MKKVDFFLLCPPKSGSTTLYEYLNKHKDIYMSPIKEPNFFSDDIDVSAFREDYKKDHKLSNTYFETYPLDKKHIAYLRDIEEYSKLFDASGEQQLRGEASTSYLRSKNAAKNIHTYNPNTKFIILLRNPVGRIKSHVNMDKRLGYVKGDLIDVIEYDMGVKEKGWGVSGLYVELGLYAEQLKRYFDIFSSDQFLILNSNALSASSGEVLSQVEKFLDISPFLLTTQKNHNVGVVPRCYFFAVLVKKVKNISFLSKFIPKVCIRFVKGLFFEPPPTLNTNEKEYLRKLYREENIKLHKLTGIDFNLTNS